jgi:hypothetical protein
MAGALLGFREEVMLIIIWASISHEVDNEELLLKKRREVKRCQ